MRRNRLLLLGVLAVVLSIGGCDCVGNPDPGGDQDSGVLDDGGTNPGNDDGGTNPDDAGTDGGVINPNEPDGGVIPNMPDGGTNGTVLDGGPGSYCVAAGALCSRTTGAACCTGVCGTDGRCPQDNNLCDSAGEACSVGTECCSNSCINGKCAVTLCQDVGAACSVAEQCCSKTCTNGTCAPVPNTSATCKVLGQSCTEATEGECCSKNCQNGVCTRSYVCAANGDICTRDVECCGNECSANGDGGVGRCLNVTGGGGGGCTQDGNPCSGGSGCCSRTCVDLGYGATICQPVGGCKLTGNFCTGDATCCGADTFSKVHCSDGRCDNGVSCNGTGNICGAGKLPDGGVININASQNCCDGQKEVCKVDSSGVPRCFGGFGTKCPDGYTASDPNCCIKPGNTCQFTDQCCTGSLCLPDSTGALKCQVPGTTTPDGGSGGACSALGTPCDGDAGTTCCPGTQCLATSELTKACQIPYTPGPGPSDGGTAADAGTDGGSTGTCSANGATCSSGSQCCSSICSGGKCTAPAACQPQSGMCTTNADCCTGLSCSVPLGSTVGTCEMGSTCSSSGQACTLSNPCCTGLSCRNSYGSACDGTSACVCQVPIN